MADQTHGQKRIGLLTSSVAHTIMHGNGAAWETLKNNLWSDDGSAFDNRVITGARAYGHAHEGEGVAKFWERHWEWNVQDVSQDGPPFFLYHQPASRLDRWLGSSPDRVLIDVDDRSSLAGLEVKSPMDDKTYDGHTRRKHYDQCQHGLLVTGFSQWWLVIHHGILYKEFQLLPDLAWQQRYLQRAEAFLDYCYNGKEVTRRKLSILDL